MISKGTKKLLNQAIKVVIFVGLFAVLYKQVFKSNDVVDTFSTIQEHVKGRYVLLIFVFLLMGINWTLETIKWKFLVDKLDNISFSRALAGILFGIAFSLFTPNRLGEYGGRVLVLRHHRIAAIVSTLIGSYSQIVVNMMTGGLALVLFLGFIIKPSFYWVSGLAFIYIVLSFILVLSYYHLDIFTTIFHKYSIFKKIAPYTDIAKQYNRKELNRLLVISFLRYITYSAQFFLLLKFFKAGIEFLGGLIVVPSVFFIQSILPTMAIVDISLRSEVSLTMMSTIQKDNEIAVVAATVTLWLINLIIPALIGGVVALGFKFLSTEEEKPAVQS
jgi:uncharacterized membrane protein YbhN (UPF0104 family)